MHLKLATSLHNRLSTITTTTNVTNIELGYIFTGMLKAAQMTVNCPAQPGNS